MKKIYVILAIILLDSSYLFAQTTEACKVALNDGIALFNSGKYAEAKVKFEAAKRINCNDAQPWIDKCTAKLNTPAKPVKSQKQIQCEQRWKDGKEAYDNGDYETALIFFKKGLAEECRNENFQDYIDMCNMKQKNAACNQYLSNGKNEYDTGNYAAAKTYFNQGLSNQCNNAIFRQLIADCENKLAYQNATLSVLPTEIEFEAAGGTKTINISTNYSSWTHSSVYSWLSIGKHTSSISLTCQANTSANERTDYFTITAGSKSIRVNIKQKGQAKALDLNRLISWNMNSNPTTSWDNGDRYKGQKNSDGKRSGLGAYYWSSNNIFYFGGWSNGEKSGNGIWISMGNSTLTNCPNCSFFFGGWSNGDKSGTGTCYDKDGKLIYYGKFANNKPTGTYPTSGYASYKFEVLSYTNGHYYIGEIQDGKRHGKGILLWGDGGMWYGEWENDSRAGYGIYIALDGKTLTGYWAADSYSSTK
jgi:tetratricopeptide (TPR) repeat protein